jgi:TPR repeat protein
MNEKNNFALVRKSSSAIEKAAPGVKRILSGMVTDALDLAKRPASKEVAVADVQFENWWQTGSDYYSGRTIPQDYAEAVKWWRKAAEQGYAKAQFNLGICYRCRLGVKRDYKEAVKWFRKAAEQNHAGAQHELAASYQFGHGVEEDEVEALNWHRKAAEQNHAESSGSLGYAYLHGAGVEKNETEAVKWLRQAADQLDEYALCDLGICYQNGGGVPQDRSEAYKLFKISAAMEQEGATLLKSLVEQMNSAEIAEGERRFREFCLENDLDWVT